MVTLDHNAFFILGLRSRTEDTFLLRFLRARKFDQERAYKQLIQYYQTRKENPDVFENLTPKRVQFLLEAGVATVLQDRAPDGSRVIVFRPGIHMLAHILLFV